VVGLSGAVRGPVNTVSRRHAEIRPESGRFVVVDVGSLNGSYGNHAQVDIVVADGDELAPGVF
jgi:pSer/pThr/pTyr-binding forkhead associated (FHA) protein